MRKTKAEVRKKMHEKAAKFGLIIDTNVFFCAPQILMLAENGAINVCITKEVYDEVVYNRKDFLFPDNIKILPEIGIDTFFSDKIYDDLSIADKSILNACIRFPGIDTVLSYDGDIKLFNWDLKLLKNFGKKVSIMRPEEFLQRYKLKGLGKKKWMRKKRRES